MKLCKNIGLTALRWVETRVLILCSPLYVCLKFVCLFSLKWQNTANVKLCLLLGLLAPTLKDALLLSAPLYDHSRTFVLSCQATP